MRKLVKGLDLLMLPLVNFVLALARQRRVLLGDWLNAGVVEAAFATLKEIGAESLGAKQVNLPVDIENVYFRVNGRRVRLSVEQYGDVALWGPRAIVTELAERIAAKIAEQRP